MSKVSFLGAGSWGTALAIMLANNGHEVTLWSAVESEVEMLQTHREHKDRLPGVKLPEDVLFTTDLKEAIVGKEFLILAVPSVFTRSTAKSMAGYFLVDNCSMFCKQISASIPARIAACFIPINVYFPSTLHHSASVRASC